MITKDQKAKLISEFGGSDKNTGSPEVQVAILTHEIEDLKKHFESNKKDNHSKRGFLAKIERRKKLLTYIKTNDFAKYKELIAKLGIRK